MKKILKYFFIILLMFFNCYAFSYPKIVILNINKVIKNSIEYKKFIKILNFKFNKKYLELSIKMNNLLNYEKKINNNKNLLNKKKNIYLNDRINLKKKNIFNKINNLKLFLNKKNVYIYKKILFKIRKIIYFLIKKYKYDLIIDSNIIIYNNYNILDITNNVIKKINL